MGGRGLGAWEDGDLGGACRQREALVDDEALHAWRLAMAAGQATWARVCWRCRQTSRAGRDSRHSERALSRDRVPKGRACRCTVAGRVGIEWVTVDEHLRQYVVWALWAPSVARG